MSFLIHARNRLRSATTAVGFRRRVGMGLGLIAVLALGASTLRGQQPAGGTVVAGTATIATTPGSTTITAGNNSVLRWNSFNVGAGQTVQFIQPGADSRVMNWIGNLTPSQINGTLLANGQVYLLNPAGVYFGRTAVVDVGRLYAIGGSLSREDFLAGLNRFTSLTGEVRNDGTLRGSAVALVGRTVLNTGTIISTDGFVALGAGKEVLLGRNGSSIYVDTGHSPASDAAAITDAAGVANTGTIDTGRGSAILAAGDLYSVAITQDGKLSGRDVRLEGQGGGDVLVSGSINAASTRAGETGGSVTITGEHVGLLAGASIDASGPAGGGTILVGGDLHGANASVRNATATWVADSATIRADATANGNGGKVIVWADGTTRFGGTISAQGGAGGGDGGFVEVSGHDSLVFLGGVLTSAPAGLGGTLLLDPSDITINAAGPSATVGTGPNFQSTAISSVLKIGDTATAGTLLNALQNNGTVTVTTGSAGAQNGDITIEDPISFSSLSTSGRTLVLNAHNNINVNGALSGGTNSFNLALNANDNTGGGAASGTGSVFITQAINTGGGTFSAGGVNFTSSGAGAVATKGGQITLNLSGNVSLGAQLSSAMTGATGGSGGNNTAGTPGDDGTGGTITIGAGLLTVTGSGSITSNGTGGNGGDGGNGTGGNNGAKGGNAGNGTAGSITVNATSVDFQTGSTVSANGTGGKGGDGGNGASGGNNGGDGGNNGNGNAGAITLNTGGAFAGAISSVGSVSSSVSAGGSKTGSGNDGSPGAAGVATAGAVTLNNSTAATASGNSVAAASLVLQGGGDVGTSAARFSTAAPALTFGKSGGATFVSSGAIDLGGTSTGTAALDLSATGAITQSNGLVAPGTLSLAAAGQTIFLNDSGNDFNIVGASGQDVTLKDANGLVLGASTVTGNFDVSVGAGGSLTQNAAVSVTGTATLRAGAANTDINLSTAANNFASAPVFGGTEASVRDFLYRNDNASAGLPAIGSMSGLRNLLIALPNSTINLGGTVTTTGTQSYQSATSLAADATLVSSGAGAAGNITFSSTVGGAHDLIVNTAGTTAFNGTVSGLTSLTTDAAGGTTLATSVTTTGAQMYHDPVTLGGNATLSGTALTLDTTLTGAGNDLTLAFSSGNPVDGAAIGGVKNLTANNGTATLSGTITTTGTQTYNAAATLGANATLVSSGVGAAGNVTFGSTVGGAHDLVVNTAGTTAFNGTVSGLTSLTTDASGSTALGAAITTTGGQTYNDNVSVETTTAMLSTTNSAIAFNGSVNSHSGAGNSLTLSTGTVAPTFASPVGGSDALGTLTITNTAAGGVTLPAVTAQNLSVSAGGAISQAAALTIAGTTSLSAAGQTILLNNAGNNFNVIGVTGQNVTLNDVNGLVLGASTVTGNFDVSVGAGGSLTQNAAVSVTGTATLRAGAANTDINLSTAANSFASTPVFGGTETNVRDFLYRNDNASATLPLIGAMTGLRNLLINLPNSTINLGGTVTTTGTQSYQSATSLAADATLVSSGVGAAGNITFNSTIGGAHNLTVNTAGTTAFNGTVSGVTSVTTDAAGATALGSSVTTTGGQTYNDAVTLGGNATLTGTVLGLGSTLAGGGNDLTLAFSSGNAVNGAVIGGVKNLTANSGATTLSGTITTTGTQTYNTAAILGADATLVSSGAGAAGNITFNSTVGGAHALTVNTAGTTAFNGTVSGVSSVTTDAAGVTTLAAAITTTGIQRYNDPVTLGTNLILTGTTLTLGSTLAGGGNDLALVFSVGNVLTGTGITAVRNLTTSVGPTTLSGAITTTGTQTYNTAVTLAGDTTLTGTTLDLGSTLNGANHDLTLALSGGNAVTAAKIFGVRNLATNTGATTLSGAIATTGTQNYTTPTTLAADVILTSSGAGAAGNITLGSTVDGAHNLGVNTAGTTTFNGTVSGVTSVTTDAPGGTTLLATITTTGVQTYNDALTLGGNMTLTGTALSLGNVLGGASHDLTLSFSSGNVVNGALITGVRNLVTNTGATTLTGAITTSGTQTYDTAVTLGGDTILTGTALGLGSTLTGANNDLTLAFSTGNTLTGAGIVGVKNLTTNIGLTTLSGAITTSGTQTYNTATTLAGDTTLTGTALGLGSTLSGAGHDLTLAFSAGDVVNGAVIGGVKNLATTGGLTTLTGPVTTSGTQTYGTAVTLSGNTTLTGTALSLGSTLAGGGNDLTLSFTLGDTLTGAGVTGVRNLTTNVGPTTLSGGITTTGTQTYNTAVTLAGDTTLTGTVLSFGSTLAGGGNDLTLAFSTGNTLTSAGITGVRNLTTNVGPTTLSGGVTTTGKQTYNTAVTLAGDTTLTGTALNLGSTLTGANHDLTLAFSTGNTVNPAVIAGLRNLTTNVGPTTLTGAITTSGTQTYNTATTLIGNTTLTGTTLSLGSTLAGGGNDLTLAFSSGNTLTSAGITGVRNLTTNVGLTTLSGEVTTSGTQTYNTAVTLSGDTTLTGTTLSLGSTLTGDGNDLALAFSSGNTVNGAVIGGVKNLSTGAGPTTLTGAITTSGTQIYNTATTLIGNTTLTGTTLSLGSTLAGAGNDLALVFSSGNTVNGAGISGVRNLNTSGGPTTLSGPITTTGTQTYGTAVTLGGNTTLATAGNGVFFGSTVNSASGSGYDLTVSTGAALASFGGAVGGSLGTLTIDNTANAGVTLPAISAQSLKVFTAGPVTNAGSLAIAGAATIDAGAGNPITLGTTTAANFGSLTLTGSDVTIREGSDMQIAHATANTLDLTTTAGAVRIDAAASSLLLRVNSAGSTSLGVVTAGSLDISAGGTVTDDNGPITVAGATSIVSRTGGNIILDNPANDFFTGTFTGNTITLSDANALILQAVLAQGQFTANAAGLLTVSTALNGASDVTLISNSSNVLLNSPVSTSGGNILIQAGQDVLQTASIANTAAGGSITIHAGSSARLLGLSTAGGAVDVTAGSSGSAQFGSALTISGPFSVTAGTGGVTFAQSLDGAGATSDLTVKTTGDTVFSAAIGAGAALHSITTDVGGTTTLAGGSVRAGSLTFGGPVVVTRDTTVTGGTANFKSDLNGSTDGGQSMLIDVSGDAVFGGAIGAAGTRFNNFTTTAGGRTLLNGGGISTTGVQTYNNAVVLGADAVFSSAGTASAGDISFNGAVDGSFALTVNTAGTTTFGGNVGAVEALKEVTTDAVGTTVFNVPGGTSASPTVKTTGAQSYNDPITLAADTAFNSASGNITVQQAVSGADEAFALIAPQGTVTVTHNLGDENARLGSVAVNSRDLVVGEDIWAKGDIALGIGNAGSQTENDFLRFNLDGADARNTRIDSLTGEIILGGGAAGSPVKTGAPLRSSIFKGNDGDLYLFAHKITMQPFERMAVRNGSLVAIADGTASGDGITLSNTAVSNYLVLASSNPGAPGIAFRSRGPADIYQAQGDAVIPDLGTDLIAGAVFFFDARFGVLPTRAQFAPTPTASSDPTFFDYATRTGNILANGGVLSIAILPDAAGVLHNVFVADLLVTNPFRPLRPNLAYLDLSTASGFGGFRDHFIGPPTFGVTSTADVPMRTLVATGAQIRNTPEQVFTPDVPRKDRETAPPDADLTSGVREQLQALGIYARALRLQERVSREKRAGLFVTVPESEHPQVSDYEVADARVEDRAVREVIRLATEAGLLDQGQKRLNEVGQALAASFDAFSATSTTGSAHEYRLWLEARHDADAMRVLQFIGVLRSALMRIELLGLTHQELEGSKAQIYGSILRSRLNADPEFLRELVQDLPSGHPVVFLPTAVGYSGLAVATP